jgi:catechol 2,3-dioxygenase-like lactoylglutathione lyase family enzyme
MEDFRVTAAYASYSVSDMEATRCFYEVKLGCTPVLKWDRADGQGVYYQLDQVPIAEILGAAGGQASLSPPEPGSFSIVVIVSDAHRAHDKLAGRGVVVTTPPMTESWGRYFGVEDPDGVPLYFVEQALRV